MPYTNDWGSVLETSFFEIWFRFIGLVPALIIAIIVVVIGIFLANMFGKIITKVLVKIYVDKAVETTGLKQILERVGFKLSISHAFGLLITWFLYAVVLVAAADILQLTQISEFLRSVVLYIPNVIIAVVIMVVGIVVGNFVYTLVKETAMAAKVSSADLLANIARWAIMVFTVAAALIQLGVARELVQILFMGLVFMIALAGGLAFGFAGKDKAKELLDKLDNK